MATLIKTETLSDHLLHDYPGWPGYCYVKRPLSNNTGLTQSFPVGTPIIGDGDVAVNTDNVNLVTGITLDAVENLADGDSIEVRQLIRGPAVFRKASLSPPGGTITEFTLINQLRGNLGIEIAEEPAIQQEGP